MKNLNGYRIRMSEQIARVALYRLQRSNLLNAAEICPQWRYQSSNCRRQEKWFHT